jgi:hypothetical protein
MRPRKLPFFPPVTFLGLSLKIALQADGCHKYRVEYLYTPRTYGLHRTDKGA